MQLAMDHLIAQQQKNHIESSNWDEKRQVDMDNLDTQLLQLTASINTESALLQVTRPPDKCSNVL